MAALEAQEWEPHSSDNPTSHGTDPEREMSGEIAGTIHSKKRQNYVCLNSLFFVLLFALCFAHLSEFDPQYFSYKVCALLFCRLLYCSSPLSISNSTVITAGMSVLVNDNRRIG